MNFLGARFLLGAAIFLLLVAGPGATGPVATAQDLGLERERARAILDKVSRKIEKEFRDPALRGLDWKGLTQQARQRINSVDSVFEMYTSIYALVAMLQDSHTVFLPPESNLKFLFGFEAKAFGEEVRIYELAEDGAVAAAELQVGDRLLGINGFRVTRNNLQPMLIDMRLLRPVTAMEFIYSRNGGPARQVRVEGKMKREAIYTDLRKIENIQQLIRELESDRPTWRSRMYGGDIAALELPYFTGDIDIWRRLVGDVKQARAFIIDLRGAPGGAVSGLEDFTGFFEKDKTVIGTIIQRDKSEPITTKPHKPFLSGPLFILVDSQSASASEIFARYFQRSGRGVVIGDRTSGSVTVARFFPQQVGVGIVVPFAVQVAIGRLFFPDGEELENRRVTPDHFCLPTPEDQREERDPCLDLAVRLAREALGMTTEEKEQPAQ